MKDREHRGGPNNFQKLTAMASVLVLVGCASPVNKDNQPTPQPIPTPPTWTSKDCESFMIPDWETHNSKQFACPKKTEDPSKRTDVILRRGKDGAVRIETTTFSPDKSKELNAQYGNVFLYPGASTRFQDPANPNCDIVVVNRPAMPSVSQECPK